MEIKGFGLALNGQSVWMLPGPEERLEFLSENADVEEADVVFGAIALFRRKDYVDYLALAEVSEEGETWTTGAYENHQFIDWLAGFALRPERQKKLRELEAEIGQFACMYGWNLDVVIEDEPSEQELEAYITYEANKEVKDGKLYPPTE